MATGKFLNLDLELRSSSDLSSLAQHFEKTASVLFNGEAMGEYRLTVETASGGLEGDVPERVSLEMLSLLEQLPPSLAMLFRQCSVRLFDFGFESGTVPPPFSADISAPALERMSALGLSARITLYSVADNA
jgi:hypothetical protein